MTHYDYLDFGSVTSEEEATRLKDSAFVSDLIKKLLPRRFLVTASVSYVESDGCGEEVLKTRSLVFGNPFFLIEEARAYAEVEMPAILLANYNLHPTNTAFVAIQDDLGCTVAHGNWKMASGQARIEWLRPIFKEEMVVSLRAIVSEIEQMSEIDPRCNHFGGVDLMCKRIEQLNLRLSMGRYIDTAHLLFPTSNRW